MKRRGSDNPLYVVDPAGVEPHRWRCPHCPAGGDGLTVVPEMLMIGGDRESLVAHERVCLRCLARGKRTEAAFGTCACGVCVEKRRA